MSNFSQELLAQCTLNLVCSFPLYLALAQQIWSCLDKRSHSYKEV